MKKFLIGLIIIIILGVAALIGGYSFLTSAPSKEDNSVEIFIEEGSTYNTIGSLLKEKGLIKNELAYKVFVKLNKPDGLETGKYILNTSNDLGEQIEVLKKGSISSATTVSVRFIEGKNMRYFINQVIENLSISEEEILNKMKDNEYLDSIIEKYWFLTKDIKNNDIYYSLEGYLYPDTYEFYSNATIEDVFESMLNNMDKKLKEYKEEIESSNYTIHQMITLASIIETEAGSNTDRKGVAGVFYNRLDDGWSLGSDVTTYYASKVELWSRDLKKSEISECNAYNTRSTCMAGKLPVGPICNASINSLVAAIEPTEHDYFYFVADKNGKTYFNETNSGHESTVSKLKKDGLWYEY